MSTRVGLGASTRRIEYVRRSWRVDADTAAAAGQALRGWLGSMDLDQATIRAVVAAAGAALANVHAHAYPPGRSGSVEVVLWTDPSMLFVEVIDHGRWRAPGDTPAGRGIALMRELAESVLIRFGARGTRVLLRHRLDPLGPARAGDANAAATDRSGGSTAPSPPARRG